MKFQERVCYMTCQGREKGRTRHLTYRRSQVFYFEEFYVHEELNAHLDEVLPGERRKEDGERI